MQRLALLLSIFSLLNLLPMQAQAYKCPFENPRYNNILQSAQALYEKVSLPLDCQNERESLSTAHSNLRTQLMSLHDQEQAAGGLAGMANDPAAQATANQTMASFTALADVIGNSQFINSKCGRELFETTDYLLLIADTFNNLVPYMLIFDTFAPGAVLAGSLVTNLLSSFVKAYEAERVDMSRPEMRQAYLSNLCAYMQFRGSYLPFLNNSLKTHELKATLDANYERQHKLQQTPEDAIGQIIDALNALKKSIQDSADQRMIDNLILKWIPLQGAPNPNGIKREAAYIDLFLGQDGILPQSTEQKSAVLALARDLEAGLYLHPQPPRAKNLSNELDDLLVRSKKSLDGLKSELDQLKDPAFSCFTVQDEIASGQLYKDLTDATTEIIASNGRLGYNDDRHRALVRKDEWIQSHLSPAILSEKDPNQCQKLINQWFDQAVLLMADIDLELGRQGRRDAALKAYETHRFMAPFQAWSKEVIAVQSKGKTVKALYEALSTEGSEFELGKLADYDTEIKDGLFKEEGRSLVSKVFQLDVSPTLAWIRNQLEAARKNKDVFMDIAKNTRKQVDPEKIDPIYNPGIIPNTCAAMANAMSEFDKSVVHIKSALTLCTNLDTIVIQARYPKTAKYCYGKDFTKVAKNEKEARKRDKSELQDEFEDLSKDTEEDRLRMENWMERAGCPQRVQR